MKNLRIACPSFIIPAERLDNAAMLVGMVHEVQLMYYASGVDVDLPDPFEVKALASLPMDYHVHMPTDRDLRDASAWDVMKRFADGLAPLSPATHTLHGIDDASFTEHLARFIRDTGASVTVENETADTACLGRGVDAGADVCVDVGHLLRDGVDPMPVLERFREHVALIHLHGVIDGVRDHRSLTFLDVGVLDAVATFALESKITVCVEVFALSHLVSSLGALERSVERITHPRHRGDQER